MARTPIPGAQDAGLAKYEREDFGGAPELFSGDTPLPVSSVTAPVTELAGFSVVGYTGNVPGAALVMANFVGSLIDDDGAIATGALTGTGVGVAGNTIVINGRTYTLRAAVVAADDILIGATTGATAINIAAAIEADPDAIVAGQVGPDTEPNEDVAATVSGSVVTLRALAGGTGGNAVTTTVTGTAWTFGGGTLTGGTDVAGGGIRPIGILTVDSVSGNAALFTAGCFNPDALVWDDSFNTDEKKKYAFFGAPTPTNIVILKPKYQPWDTGN